MLILKPNLFFWGLVATTGEKSHKEPPVIHPNYAGKERMHI